MRSEILVPHLFMVFYAWIFTDCRLTAGDVLYRQFCAITAVKVVKVGVLGDILLFSGGRAEKEVNICDLILCAPLFCFLFFFFFTFE